MLQRLYMHKANKILGNVLNEIEAGLKVDVDTDYLADKFSMSATHLRRLFNSAFGQSIGTYIRSRKMAASVEDLLKTKLNVLDIACEYGLDYEQSYIRAFKREYGLTPGELRKLKSEESLKKMSPLCLFDPYKLTDNALLGHDTIKTTQKGIRGAYNFETWKDTGNIAMSLTDSSAEGMNGGGFKCKWNNSGDAIFRTGKNFDEHLKHSQIGCIEVDYGISFFSQGGSYIGVYGWTLEPLVEFYIIENGALSFTNYLNHKARVSIDSGTYKIYEFDRIKQPTIIGINNFKQYWSIRTNNRLSGIVTVSEHFKAWEKLGMPLGTIYEIAFAVEGIQSSGAAEIYRNVLSLDKKAIGKNCA